KYGSAGSYLVTITGTDSFGDPATTTASITVAPKPLLSVDISATGTATAGLPVSFTINAQPTTGNQITSVSIDFGDGSTPVSLSGNVKVAVHPFSASCTYVVTAVATDSGGSTGTGTTVIFVGGINASFSTTNGASGSKLVNFNASGSTSSSTITSYVWDFGDGTAQGSGVTTSHTYASAGPFTVR